MVNGDKAVCAQHLRFAERLTKLETQMLTMDDRYNKTVKTLFDTMDSSRKDIQEIKSSQDSMAGSLKVWKFLVPLAMLIIMVLSLLLAIQSK